MKVAVIGGGWAGLAAAVELVAAGADVTVFEAAKQLGGRARSVETHGHRLDNGQHLLIGAYRETLRLIQTVGANPEHLLRRLPLDLHYPGAGFRLRLPRLPALNLAIGLFTAQGASLGEKFAAVRFMRYLQGCNYRLATDGTVAELLDRHGQQGKLRRYLWEPLCLAALNTAAHHASAQIFANVLRDSLGGTRADTDLLLPAADLDRVFPSAAADYVRAHGGKIRLATRVEQIRPQLHIEGELFDRVILAVSPQHAASLLAGQPETAAIAAMLAEYTYEPIGTAYAGYPPEVSLPCPMLGLDAGREGSLGQWVFDRGTLCATPGVMSFVLSAQGAWDQRDNETLATLLHGELEELLARKLPRPLWNCVIRERRATFSCRPDLPRPAAQTPLQDLWLAGDYTCADYPATLEGAVRSGIAAASGALMSRPGGQ
ncbi:MAG: FAD-dependent oxidoreductase [Propionivibrio sp.]|uniref:FAD-dependent oxidoreductase n=1 Tax=Candidatus Propionivibrio dominans TaxID=2954373 RepID=A0A9D7FFA1_9RHOO|nr:FAD-dependent oxidoreductase [Candidatus Propionivibrio dominans]